MKIFSPAIATICFGSWTARRSRAASPDLLRQFLPQQLPEWRPRNLLDAMHCADPLERSHARVERLANRADLTGDGKMDHVPQPLIRHCDDRCVDVARNL